MVIGAEIGMMYLQAKEHQVLTATKQPAETRKNSLLEPSNRTWPGQTYLRLPSLRSVRE